MLVTVSIADPVGPRGDEEAENRGLDKGGQVIATIFVKAVPVAGSP